MWKKLLGIPAVLLLVVSFCDIVYADGPYSIGFQYIQKRIYEHNKSVNRLGLAMYDPNANALVAENVIDDVVLYDGDGEIVPLGDVGIENVLGKYPKFYAPYSPNTPRYDGFLNDWTPEGYYSRIILGDLKENSSYHIIVTYHALGITNPTYTTDSYYYYRGEVFLPVVSASSFKYEFDQDQNLYFSWEIPAKDIFNMDHTLFNDPSRYPSIRAMINRYDSNGDIYNLWIELPYLSTGVFIPVDSGILDGADSIEIGVQFRTRDNSNRTFSNFKEIKKLP